MVTGLGNFFFVVYLSAQPYLTGFIQPLVAIEQNISLDFVCQIAFCKYNYTSVVIEYYYHLIFEYGSHLVFAHY